MAESRRQLTVKKLALAVVGVAVVASFSFGGWTLWSANEVGAVDVAATQPIIRPEPKPVVNDPPKALPVQEKDSAAKPVTESPVIDEQPSKQETPKKETPRKKEPTTGKDHERQEVMLANMVQRLHQEAYHHFISQPGMGFSRMMPTITVVKREWKMPDWSSEELSKEPPPLKVAKDLELIHRLSLQGFGDSNTKTPKERWEAEVKKQPAKKEQLWEIKSLDLVGLVMHETPIVYVSEKLPDMKDLKSKPTRQMDLFESEGLEELANGKEIYIRSKEGTIRVLGPIHAGKACLKCHGDSKEGAMLGAFSYTLRAGQYQSNIPGFPIGPKTAPPTPKS